MSVSVSNSGYQIIDQSSKMAEEAAREINQRSLPQPIESKNNVEGDNSLEFNKVDFDKAPPERSNEDYASSHTDSLIKLNQASKYHRIGTNVLQRDQEMLGTLLDIHV
ncbi:hypothetical protein M9194_00250 [Vibrio sp. S4M6]|uniref:hypothetical protein n=1 Tax=Vibrio sinus TaxID=2946865 RepID=UPI00202A3A1E|nr:hypothetical protein [Vibrio sinus]MCL9779862.1 hypothetical protein [Vibrio sinus]